jgi:hypothetical protein
MSAGPLPAHIASRIGVFSDTMRWPKLRMQSGHRAGAVGPRWPSGFAHYWFTLANLLNETVKITGW